MKSVDNLIIVFLIAFAHSISSCEKSVKAPMPLASLTITNVIVNGVEGKYENNPLTIPNNSYVKYGLMVGENIINVSPIDNVDDPYYTGNITAAPGENYSLFLTGQSTIEGILIKDEIPARTDSTMGIRFINLSPNSTALNITLESAPSVNEVSNLEYKQYTEFKSFETKAESVYSFQVRRASDNAILTTVAYTIDNIPRFSNVTLVIRDLVEGNPAIGVTQVDNDRPKF